MDWKEEMKTGMLMIQSACQKCQNNSELNSCRECPFDDFCDYIYDETFQLPEKWNLESKDN